VGDVAAKVAVEVGDVEMGEMAEEAVAYVFCINVPLIMFCFVLFCFALDILFSHGVFVCIFVFLFADSQNLTRKLQIGFE
jgi:hypothetical protein